MVQPPGASASILTTPFASVESVRSLAPFTSATTTVTPETGVCASASTTESVAEPTFGSASSAQSISRTPGVDGAGVIAGGGAAAGGAPGAAGGAPGIGAAVGAAGIGVGAGVGVGAPIAPFFGASTAVPPQV